jgi:hypothetical protein
VSEFWAVLGTALRIGRAAHAHDGEPSLHDNFNGPQVAVAIGWLFGKGY